MRLLLPLLVLLAGAPAQAEEAPRQAAARSQESRTTPRGGTPRAGRVSAAALASARAYLCPNGGTPQGRGRCSRAVGGAGLGTGWLGDDPSVRDWDQGLPPPTRAQAPCPPGTRAIPARDQPLVTRCVAG